MTTSTCNFRIHALISVLATTLLIAASATRSSASGAAGMQNDLRSYFQCEDCDTAKCPAVSVDCPLRPVLESGVCGCCKVCPLAEGDPCGVYTRPCGEGMRCGSPRPVTRGGGGDQRRQRPGDDGIRSLFYGEGRCMAGVEQKGIGKYGAGEKFRRFRF